MKCRFCNFLSVTKHGDKRHRKEEHREPNNTCELCKSTHPGPNALLQHLEEMHFKLQKWKCLKCDFSAKNKGKLKSHIHLVHVAIHECPYCDHKSAIKQTLTNHVKSVHDKMNMHNCLECDYAATHKWHLRRHMKAVHDKIREHKCTQCGNAANTKNQPLFACKSCPWQDPRSQVYWMWFYDVSYARTKKARKICTWQDQGAQVSRLRSCCTWQERPCKARESNPPQDKRARVSGLRLCSNSKRKPKKSKRKNTWQLQSKNVNNYQ
jgi:hypothetical protein